MVMPDEVEFNPYDDCKSLSEKVGKLRSYLRHTEDIKILDEVLAYLKFSDSFRTKPPKA